MLLCDVNVLVYAHRADAPDHEAYRAWLEGVLNGNAAYGVSDVVLSGFLRVVTHPRVFDPPSRLEAALAFAEQIRGQPNAVVVTPGERHWAIFAELCAAAGTKGNLIPDAFLAALAIESGSRWITTDRDYSRFPGLDWAHPLDE
ncbi:MAG: type II toxin-antitoxin system VapC family toxin [Candidatus Promineifilaceae bacterium]|nr:type II toxin-antitoxin system VapC family toxin [Candidatus Promineifilaceae bacterium]